MKANPKLQHYVILFPVSDPEDSDDCLPNYVMERVDKSRQVFRFLVDAEAFMRANGLKEVDYKGMHLARGGRWQDVADEMGQREDW